MVTLDVTPVTLEPRAKLQAKVLKITLAGALLDIGQPIPGVLHISQLRKDPVKSVDEVLKEGQAVDVWVRKVRRDRVELTMIQPLAYDWNDLNPEMVIKGKVVRLEPYGAFVDFGAERPGMIHISEMARGYVKSASEVVKEGDEVEAVILNVDRQKHQIRLSMKALQPQPVEEPRPSHDPGPARHTRKSAPAEEVVEAEPSGPELTAMQIAWQTAQERARSHEKPRKARREKPDADEREAILNRTLERRVPTGS